MLEVIPPQRTSNAHRAFLCSLAGLTGLGSVLALGGCRSDLWQRSEDDLRRSILGAVERELEPIESAQSVTLAPENRIADLGLSEARIQELDAMSGPDIYGSPLDVGAMGSDLTASASLGVPLSLNGSVLRAVQNNLQIQSSRINPAIRESDVVQAEAAFDWVLSSDLQWTDTDQPIPSQEISPGIRTAEVNSSQNVSNTTGLSRRLTSGGSVSISQQTVYTDNRTVQIGTNPEPNPGTSIDLTLGYAQPLLRGAGADVVLAEVRLSRNAERDAVAALEQDLLDLVTEVEAAYWNLDVAQRTLRIQERLLERGIAVRDQLRERIRLDATPAQVADAVARVERRRADVERARNTVRQLSDAFKALINDPALVVGDTSIVVVADRPPEEPIEYSLPDAIRTAVRERPDIERAVLSIDNASIRQLVADNGRLPRLDLSAQLTMASLGRDLGDAYDELPDNEFFDNFLFGVSYEQELGNRADEAAYRQRRLERMQAAVAYRAAVQNAVLDVRNALNDVRTNYTLIEQSRVSRLAAAEVLRALLIEKDLTRGYTVERLDLELSRQEQLAIQEVNEARALADYNIAIAQLHRATGTALYRNRIDFVVPDVDQLRREQTPAGTPVDELYPPAAERSPNSGTPVSSTAGAEPGP
jgi:outer membrane protein